MTKKDICIAVDAMGGDHAPFEIVKGAVDGARTQKVSVLLVGQLDAVNVELAKYDTTGLDIQVQEATEVIGMDESPATAIRKKKDASIIVTAKSVRKGRADAMVAAGSTGAAMASALFNIGRIDGVDRPAIGVVMPSVGGKCILVDAGANVDCIPEMLLQFAHMGMVYMENVYGIKDPTVGLLNIGSEKGKGNSFVNTAFDLLTNSPGINFYGNIEGKDVFFGVSNVAVCDGFTGNVALKSAEGVMRMFKTVLKKEFQESLSAKAGYLLVKPAIEKAANFVDPEEFGGALLLGIKGICVISHGGSKARGIMNAIRVAKEAVETDVITKTATAIKENIHAGDPST